MTIFVKIKMVKSTTTKKWDPTRKMKEALRAKKCKDDLITVSNKARQILQSGISMNDVQQRLLINPKDRVYIQVRELLHCADIQKKQTNTVYPRDPSLPPIHPDLMKYLKELQTPSNTVCFPKPDANIELSPKQIGNLLHVLKTPDTCVHVWSSMNFHYYQYHSNTHGVIAVAQNIDDLNNIFTFHNFVYHVEKQKDQNQN